MLLRKITSLAAIAGTLAFFSCQDDHAAAPETIKVSFTSFGLDQKIVNELELIQNKLYAATDQGLYVRDLATTANWVPLGLAQKNVRTLVSLGNNTLLAATANPAQEEFLLYRSQDGGQTWNTFENNYGGGAPEPINDFAYDAQKNILYACGWGVVAASQDGGVNWNIINGDWQTTATGMGFVALNPANGDLWSGGQNAIETFVLHRRAASSGAWQSWNTLLPSPSVGKSIAFSEGNPQIILIGAEDGIIKTNNHGATWSTSKEDHSARFYFGLEFDHEVHDRVYAASWVKNFDDPQPLVLSISEDAGSSWTEYTYANNTLFGGVWSMVQRSEGNKTKLYLGLYKGGVYEATIEETNAPSTHH